MKRITAKDLMDLLKKVPDDTIIALQSDSEGNSTSTCLDMFVDRVGKTHSETYADQTITWVGGDDIDGVDLDTDKDKFIVILQPSL